MLRIERAIKQQLHSAPIVPGMYPTLAMQGVAIRRGEVSMIAGPPGSGKSTIALALAVRAAVPTVYCSADSHAHTMALRLLAMLANRSQTDVEPVMESHPDWCASELQRAKHIRWCFSSAPSMGTVENEIVAHEELYGDTPELVVVDNLTDVVSDQGGDEWAIARSLLKDAKYIAREHDTAVLILHHTSEAYQLPDDACPPLRSLQGKVGQTPALVPTVNPNTQGALMVSAVKNRYGPATPSGHNPVWLGYNPTNMQIWDPSEAAR